MTQVNQVLQKTKQVLARAQELFGLDMAHVGIRFDLRGRAAGQAARRGHQYYIRYNRDMLTREAFDHVYNNTIPHEVAHIVCFMKPELGHNHNSGWERVCKLLGGNGERCHQEDVVYGKGNTYEYTTTNGHKVRVSDRIHQNILRGMAYSYKRGVGKIHKECEYSLVGVSGRTITAPTKPAVQAHTPPVEAVVKPAAPATTVARSVTAGASKASVSRSIMLAGYNSGKTYEEIIAAMIAACGYDRQLARATFKANAAKVGIPVQ